MSDFLWLLSILSHTTKTTFLRHHDITWLLLHLISPSVTRCSTPNFIFHCLLFWDRHHYETDAVQTVELMTSLTAAGVSKHLLQTYECNLYRKKKLELFQNQKKAIRTLVSLMTADENKYLILEDFEPQRHVVVCHSRCQLSLAWFTKERLCWSQPHSSAHQTLSDLRWWRGALGAGGASALISLSRKSRVGRCVKPKSHPRKPRFRKVWSLSMSCSYVSETFMGGQCCQV